MASNVDYFEILPAIRPDIRAALVRDFEATAECNWANRGKEKATNDKETVSSWRERKFGKKGAGSDNDIGPGKDTKKGKRRSKEEWADGRKKLGAGNKGDPSPTPGESHGRDAEK